MSTRHLVACTFAILLALAIRSAQADDTIQWAPDFASAREIAQVQNRPVLLHFWSPSCIPCMRLEKDVFSRAEVGKAINEQFIAVKVNADEQPQLAEQYGVRSIPCDVVVTPTGQIVYKTVSPSNAETYVQKLVSAAQSPTALIAQRLSQQAAAANTAVAQTVAATNPTTPTLPAAAPPAAPAAEQLTAQASQLAGPFAQQLSETQQAAEQQAQSWQQGLRAQTQQLIDQSGQRVNTQLQRGVDKVATAAQPTGEAISKTAEQVTQTAQNFQSNFQQVQQQALAAPAAAAGQLEQLNPFVTAAAPAAPAATAATTPPTMMTPPGTPVAAAVPAQPLTPPVQSLAAQAAAAAATQSASTQAAATQAAVAAPALAAPAAEPIHQAPPFPNGAAQPPLAAAQPPVAAAQTAESTPWPAQAAPGTPSAPVNPPPAPAAALAVSAPAATTPPMPAAPAPPVAKPAGQVAGSPKSNQPPRLGLDGFCPVTLMSENRWQQGDKRWGAVHRGRTYLFTSRKNQLEFLANPDRFAPVLAGIDPVVLTTKGQVVEGKRAHGVVYKDEVHGDQIYLFSSEESLKEFWVKPTAYAGTVRQAMVDGTVGSFLR
ncbi:MAG: thioredoxin family protein [Pirellulales bacterium]